MAITRALLAPMLVLLSLSPARAGVEFVNRSKNKDDSCARFEANAREVLASPLFPALIAIGADGQIEGQVRSGVARAAALGLKQSSDVIGFLMLRRALGERFEESREPGRAAVAAVLREKRQAGRVSAALRKAGRPDLELVVDAFARCGRFRSVHHGSRTVVRSGDLLVAPDGMVISVGATTLGGTKLTTSVELRLRLPAEEGRIVLRVGESQPWRNLLLGLVESEKSRGAGARLTLALEPWDKEGATRRLAFGKPVPLAVGDAARAPDGLTVTVRRITSEPPFALIGLKRGKEQHEIWIKPGASAPHAWLDYMIQLRALAARSYPKRSSVELLVAKPKESVVDVFFDTRFTLKREESARFPDGLRLTFLGARKRQLKRGGTVAYLQLRLAQGRRVEEAPFELFEPGRGWTRTLAWKGYRIQLPGDREKTTEMEFVVSK